MPWRMAAAACGGGEVFGDGDEAVGGGEGEGGVGAGNAAPGYAIADAVFGDIGGELDDGAGGLLPEGVGEGGGIAAFAEVGVDEVDAGGFDADEGLPGAGVGSGRVVRVRTSGPPVAWIWMACMGELDARLRGSTTGATADQYG